MTTYKPQPQEEGAVTQAKRWLPLGVVFAAIVSSWAVNEYRLSTHEELGAHVGSDERIKSLELKDASLESDRKSFLNHLMDSRSHQTDAERQVLINQAVSPIENRLIRIEENQKTVARTLDKISDKLNIQ